MALADDTRGFEHRFLETNGVKLHTLVGGSGPLVVLLHGFPECWAAWRHMLQPFKDAGFTVAAPDLRGFNLSDKPKEVSAYEMQHVAADIAGLIRALGFEKAHVVGHDWGGVAAWHFAHLHPERLDQLVIANAPHPRLFARRLRKSLKQLAASSYIFFFQIPGVAERALEADGYGALDKILRHQPRRKGAYDDEDLRVYKEALGQPRATTTTLNWYRAAFRQTLRARFRGTGPEGVIERPVLVLWALEDVALPPENLDGLDQVASDLRVVKVPGSSHWILHEKPELVVEECLRFFRQ